MENGVVIWLLVGGLLYLAMRWLAEARTPAMNRPALRAALRQWLLNLRPELDVEEAEDALRVTARGRAGALYLEQLLRRCRAYPEHAALLVEEAAMAFVAALNEEDGLPADWADQVLPQLLPDDAADPALARQALLAGVQVGYVLPRDGAFRWITQAELAAAGVSAEALGAAALRNIERSCNRLVIDARDGEDEGEEMMLRFQTGDGLDAARLLVPTFFQRFGPRFAEAPLLVAVPTRDTLIMVSTENLGAAGWLAWRSRQDYHRQAYPLLPTLLRVTERGITPA
ncbi:MAG TPA: DUF1444 family protein [Armatimonadota bacterium]|nr:DUF1444 family protein [Armatimonadota bacterium]HOS43970.1 DUF1444 family protein [Armatimonadota bacterium]